MSLVVTALIFFVALFALVKSADTFVHYAARIARRFGVSEFVIGLTLVAIGTSLPELANVLISSLRGDNSIAIGNIIGANIANICVSIGLASFLVRVRVEPKYYRRELIVLGVATTVFLVAALDGFVARSEGAVLLVLFAVYLQLVTKILFDFSRLIDPKELEYFVDHLAKLRARIAAVQLFTRQPVRGPRWNPALTKDVLALSVSTMVLVYSSDILVQQAVQFASAFGTSTTAIGATIVAIGTTMPELTVALASVRRGYYHMLFGNIIGSNIVNLLLIGGLAAVILPFAVPAAAVIGLFFLGLATLAVIVLLSRKGTLSRVVALALLGFYVAFLLASWFSA
jgi:cation:H+ antiporter